MGHPILRADPFLVGVLCEGRRRDEGLRIRCCCSRKSLVPSLSKDNHHKIPEGPDLHRQSDHRKACGLVRIRQSPPLITSLSFRVTLILASTLRPNSGSS